MSTQTDTKFTPGPWTLETVETSCGICHKIGPFPWKQGKQNYACIYVDYPGNGEIERELLSNARLIAAAPEFMQEAEHMLAEHDTNARAANFTCCGCRWCDAMRPIVAKAKGQP